MNATDIAYLAGLIDGEGSLFAAPTRRSQALSYSCRLSISNSSVPLMEWLVANLDGTYRITGHPGDMGGWKRNVTVYQWLAYRQTAERVIRMTLPHLIVKRAKAEAWLHLASLIHPRGTIKITNGPEREAAFAALKAA